MQTTSKFDVGRLCLFIITVIIILVFVDFIDNFSDPGGLLGRICVCP